MARQTYDVNLTVYDSSNNVIGGVAYFSGGVKNWANDLTMTSGMTAYQMGDYKRQIPSNLRSSEPVKIEIYTYRSFRGDVHVCNSTWNWNTLTESLSTSLKLSGKSLYADSWADITSVGKNIVLYGVAFKNSTSKVNTANRMRVTYAVVPTVTSNSPNGNAYAKGETIPFSWTSSTVSEFSQTRYELQYKLTTSSTWTTVTGGSGSSYSLSSSSLATGSYQWRVRVGDAEDWSDYSSTKTFAIGDKPTISNLELDQLNIDNPLVLSWRGTSQQKYEIKVYQNNVLKKSYAATTATASKTIPVGDITTIGSTSFMVRLGNSVGSATYWTDWLERSFTLTATSSSASNLAINQTNVDNDIVVTWQSTNQSRYQIEVWQSNTLLKTYTGTTVKSRTIPKGEITTTGSHTFKLKTGYDGVAGTMWGTYIEKGYTLTTTSAGISGLSVDQSNIDNPFVVSWQSTNQSLFEIEVWKDNVKKKTYTGTTATSFTIPVGQITEIGEHVFKARVAYNSVAGVIWSGYASVNKTLTRTIPRITNFEVIEKFWEKDIRTNWRSENQSRFVFEILKDNNTIHTFYGETENAFIIPKGTLTTGGDYTFRVCAVYVPVWSSSNVVYGEWVERKVTLTDIIPTVSNLVLSGSNIDLALTLSWDSTDQDKYEIEVYKDSTRVDARTGTTANNITYPHGTFTVGLHKFRVRVAYAGTGGDKWTEWKEISTALTETLPSVGILEPDGVIVDRDTPLKVWWTSSNQTKWKLVIDGVLEYRGYTEKEYTLSAGSLQTGVHNIVLTVTYVTSNNVEKHTSKRVEFITQGKPSTPTITSASEYTNNRPTVTWDTQDQQGYILDIMKDNNVVWSTDWKNGLVTSCKVMTYLENGSYTARIKIINEFGMESEYGVKQFTINAYVGYSIDLQIETFENANRLIWNNRYDTFKAFYILRDNVVIAKVTGNEYTDYTAHNQATYTIKGIDINDNFKDSNSVDVSNTVSVAVIGLGHNPSVLYEVGISVNNYEFGGNIGLEYTLHQVAGRINPVVVFGDHERNTYTLKCHEPQKALELVRLCREKQIFVYRDRVQKLYLTIVNPSYTLNNLGLNYELTAYEVDYKEVVEYD